MNTSQSKIERPRNHRWSQYGLRTLLGSTFVAAVCFAWARYEMHRHRQMQVVIAAIGDLGGTVTLSKPTAPAWLRKWLGDKYFQEPLGINLFGRAIEPSLDGLDLRPFDKLERLNLSWCTIDDEWLSRISGLKRLKSLDLSQCSITDAGMIHLCGLTEMEDLCLFETDITDAGLSPLQQMRKLRRLDLRATNVVDLCSLASLVTLEMLELAWCPIGDDQLIHLKQLSKLETLNLSFTEITDKGLVHLGRLTHLKKLGLENNRITDAGLKQLYGLNELNTLVFSSSVISPALLTSKGRSDLQQRIAPGASVDGNVQDYEVSVFRSRIQRVRRGDDKELRLTGLNVLHLEQIEGLHELERLDLGWTHVDDEGLKHIAGLSGLKRLDLSRSWITDAGLAHVARLLNLEYLDLSNTHVTDAGLAQLRNLTRLTRLNLHNTFVSGVGIRHLVRLTALKELVVSRNCGDMRWSRLERTSGVTDKGCAALGLMRGLSQLDLSNIDEEGSQITNTGIKHLAALSELRDLNVTGAKITDEALSYLGELPKLESLGLYETNVSKAGVDRLKAKLKGLHVEDNFSTQ